MNDNVKMNIGVTTLYRYSLLKKWHVEEPSTVVDVKYKEAIL